jgi:hypothetical protein
MSSDRRDFGDFERLKSRQTVNDYFRQATGIVDNFPVPSAGPSTLFLRATTARDVLLPFVNSDMDGRVLTIYNEGTGVITLKTSSDAALSPARTISGNASMVVQAVNGLAQTAAWKALSVT